MIGTLKDYTELVKEYTPKGQQTNLWEQFLTGTSQQYQTAAKQVQDVYAYDISQAYANYKQQQLQLQMNEQLGTGFKQHLSSQLKEEYGSAYSDIKTQELSALGDVAAQYQSAIATGEKEFSKIGTQIKQLDRLIQEYEQSKTTPTQSFGDIYDVTTDESGRQTQTLTEAGRLWYYDVMDENFQNWLLSEDSLSDIKLEDRESIAEALSGTYRNLYLEAVGGIGEWDAAKAEEVRNKILKQNRDIVTNTVRTNLTNRGPEFTNIYGDFSNLSTEQLELLNNNLSRTNDYISTIEPKIGMLRTMTDSYGNSWKQASENFIATPGSGSSSKTAEQLGKKINVINSKGWINTESPHVAGDVVYIDGSYYMITELTKKSVGFRKIERV